MTLQCSLDLGKLRASPSRTCAGFPSHLLPLSLLLVMNSPLPTRAGAREQSLVPSFRGRQQNPREAPWVPLISVSRGSWLLRRIQCCLPDSRRQNPCIVAPYPYMCSMCVCVEIHFAFKLCLCGCVLPCRRWPSIHRTSCSNRRSPHPRAHGCCPGQFRP